MKVANTELQLCKKTIAPHPRSQRRFVKYTNFKTQYIYIQPLCTNDSTFL